MCVTRGFAVSLGAGRAPPPTRDLRPGRGHGETDRPVSLGSCAPETVVSSER